MRYYYVETIEGSTVVQFVASAWVALMKEGLWEKTSVLISSSLSCVYAMDKGKAIGCLTWHFDESQAVVNLVYVLPTYRKRGVYGKLHQLFIEKVRGKAKVALNICYLGNTGIQRACYKVGYKQKLVYLVYEIGEKG